MLLGVKSDFTKFCSPLDETAVQCESDNTGNCLHCHTWRVHPTHRRVSHSDKELTCIQRVKTFNPFILRKITHNNLSLEPKRGSPVLKLSWISPSIPTVVVVGARIALSA